MKKEMKTVKKSYDVDQNGHIGWSELDVKDKIAYTLSCVLVGSGILMAFLCLIIKDDITDGVLFYVGESFVTGGGLLGVGIYTKTKFGEIANYLHKKLDDETEA